jgi:outer membrane immunogenic protein
MKKLLLGTVALAALGAGATANAADLGVRRAVVAAPVAYTNWTGCHLGGAVGNEWGNSDPWSTTSATTLGLFNGPTAAPNTPLNNGFSMNGFIGGFYGGCDYQVGYWVFGIEGDWSSLNKSGQTFEIPPFNTLFVNEAQERWIATVRGRLGYAVDRWMFYVTGGGAWVRIDSSEWSILAPSATGVTQSDTRSGWTVGAGLEYGLSYGWSVRSEYLYVQIPSFTTFTPGSGTGLSQFSHTFVNEGKLSNNIWRAGLTYKFGYYTR